MTIVTSSNLPLLSYKLNLLSGKKKELFCTSLHNCILLSVFTPMNIPYLWRPYANVPLPFPRPNTNVVPDKVPAPASNSSQPARKITYCWLFALIYYHRYFRQLPPGSVVPTVCLKLNQENLSYH